MKTPHILIAIASLAIATSSFAQSSPSAGSTSKTFVDPIASAQIANGPLAIFYELVAQQSPQAQKLETTRHMAEAKKEELTTPKTIAIASNVKNLQANKP